ncbi:MAG: c-type cytochrome domain-containing protein [Planctomycetota bacterium]
MRTLILSVAGVLCIAAPCAAAEAVPSYEQHVAPILKKYCAGCHNQTELDGEFSLESFADLQKGGPRGPAILAGDSKSSRLIRMLTGQAKPAMPPKNEPVPQPEEIALLKAWIDAGAIGPQGAEPIPLTLNTPKIAAANKAKAVTAVAWSPDGKLLAVARFSEVQLLDAVTRQPLSVISGQPGKVNSVKFSADGRWLVIASGVTGLRGQATLWDVAANKLGRQFDGHRDILFAAILSADGKTLATGSYDRQIILWNAETGEQLRTLKGHNDAIYDLAFNPAGTVVASASGDQTVKLWQVATGTRLDTLSQPLKEQFCVSFSPDGQAVVAGGVDNRLRVWKFMSADVPQINPLLLARFAHEGPLVQLAFSKDGKQLVSVSEDRTVKLWDATTYTQTYVFEKQPDITAALAWSPAGDQFVLGRMDGSLQFYPIQAGTGTASETKPALVAATAIPDAPMTTLAEHEANDLVAEAQAVTLPATITAAIQTTREGQQGDVDVYRFDAKAGQQWVFEINAARSKSPLDSKLEILTADGQPVQRLVLQAVRDSYITFRGMNSTSRDCRLHNWEEMRLNEYVYLSGEIVKLFLAPRGPDSGFSFYPHDGSRRGYFDTTPTSHAVNEPCYSVVPHAVGEPLVPNGLPVFPIYFENDDDGWREWGDDSRLTFTAPTDASYLVRVTDVRGFQGEAYKYTLTIRPARPNFDVTLQGAKPTINLGSGKEFSVTANRHDEFEGEIRVDIKNLPPGFGVTTPLIIPAGHTIARGTLNTLPTAKAPTPAQVKAIEIRATATVNGQDVTKPVPSFDEIKLGDAPKIFVQVLPMEPQTPTASTDPNAVPVPAEITIAPGQTITARVRIERRGYDGQVQFEAINQNLPHGVIIDNIGLNGLMIVDGQTERVFFLTAADWVPDQSRTFHLKSQEEGGQTSWPVILHVKRPVVTQP